MVGPGAHDRRNAQQLTETPQLAALHVLAVALATTERALAAAHPHLDELADPKAWPPASEWLADAILVHVTALEVAIHRYRTHLQARERQRGPTDF